MQNTEKPPFVGPDNKKVVEKSTTYKFSGRDDWIRTSDFLHPMQALYQAELRPE